MFAFCHCVSFISNFNLVTVGRTKKYLIDLFAFFVRINLIIIMILLESKKYYTKICFQRFATECKGCNDVKVDEWPAVFNCCGVDAKSVNPF